MSNKVIEVKLKSDATDEEWEGLCTAMKRIYAKCDAENLEFFACYDVRFIDLKYDQLMTGLCMFEALRPTTKRLCKRTVLIVSPNIMSFVEFAFSWYKPSKPVDFVNSPEEAEHFFKKKNPKKHEATESASTGSSSDPPIICYCDANFTSDSS